MNKRLIAFVAGVVVIGSAMAQPVARPIAKPAAPIAADSTVPEEGGTQSGIATPSTATEVILPARFPANSLPPPTEADVAPVAMLVDLGSGRVLYARDTERAFLPASVTKTMTAFVAFEMLAKGELRADQKMTVSEAAYQEWHAKGSRMFLEQNSQVAVDDLLRGIMTVSANDGCVVLAEGATGSVANWVAKMNDAARRLGMNDSHFGTPNGWMDGGITHISARDLVKLADAMITRYPEYYHRYVGNPGMVWNGIAQRNHDPILGVVEGADGIKTGFTDEAHYNFLGSAERNGRRLVMVLAGVDKPVQRKKAARALMEWGFAAWENKPLVAAGTQVGAAKVQGGAVASVPLVAPRAYFATLAKGATADVALRIVYNGPLKAPIAKGAEVASLEIRMPGEPASRVPLIAAQDVEPGGITDRIKAGLLRLFT